MVHWNVNPDIVKLGPITIRWYGLLFATSFIVGYEIMVKIFRKEKKNEDDLNDLIWYMILGTVIGARLGHVFFYDPSYYLSHPIEILEIWKGGLASHGAAIGILIALYYYAKKKPDQSYLWILDRIAIPVALAGFFIRTGNLFNSEIIGKPTHLPWAFVFERVDNVPRHPTPIYEALAYLAIFFFLWKLYRSKNGKFPDGYLFSLFLILVFTFRFFVEFIKVDQSAFERGMILDMGQLLSIPLIIVGVFLYWKIQKKKKEKPINNNKTNIRHKHKNKNK